MNDKSEKEISRDTGMHHSMSWSCINFCFCGHKWKEMKTQKGVSSSFNNFQSFFVCFLVLIPLIIILWCFDITLNQSVHIVSDKILGWFLALSKAKKFQRLSNYVRLSDGALHCLYSNNLIWREIGKKAATTQINLCRLR